MDDPKLLERMRADWNERAGIDANYFVAFAQREQDDEEFFGTAADVVRDLESQLKRLRGRDEEDWPILAAALSLVLPITIAIG